MSAVWLAGLLFAVSVANPPAPAVREPDWCADNEAAPAEDSIMLTEGMSARDTPRFTIVRWDRQAEARARLAKVSMLPLTRTEADGLIRYVYRFKSDERILLVRGAALLGDTEQGARSRLWSAFYSPSAKRLSIYSRGPGSASAERGNVAVLIELDAPVSEVEVVCGIDQ